MRLLKPCTVCKHSGVRKKTKEGLFYIECERCRHKTKAYSVVHFAVTAWNKGKSNRRTIG